MTHPINEQPLYLTIQDESIFGVLHEPATPPVALAVFCNPLFEERKSAHRALVEQARRFCENGIAVLRFDYRGCGESSGSFYDYTISDWCDDLEVAATFLTQRHPATPLGFSGLRFGGAVALSTVQAGKIRPAFTLLWEPVLDGNSYIHQELRKKLMQQMITFGRSGETRKDIYEKLDNGKTVDFDGYTLTPRLYRDLKTLSLTDTARTLACPTLLLNISAGGHLDESYTPLQEKAQHADATLDIRTVRHQPFWNLIGYVNTSELTEIACDWVLRHITAPAPGSTRTSQKHPAPTVSSRTQMTHPDASSEQCVLIENESERLHGIRHDPPSHLSSGQTAVIFLPGWSGDRGGPHRMFVKTARHLAAHGISCLRFDYRGRGDSEGSTNTASIESMIRDAHAAVDHLRTSATPTAVYLLGICSGGKIAIAKAARDKNVEGLILWSAEAMAHLRDSSAAGTKSRRAAKAYLRKLMHPGTWRKIFTGKVDRGAVGKALFNPEQPDSQEIQNEAAYLKDFKNFGGCVLFIYGGNDPDTAEAAKNYQAFCRRNHIRHHFHEIPNANHSFYSTSWEEEVIKLTSDWLEGQ